MRIPGVEMIKLMLVDGEIPIYISARNIVSFHGWPKEHGNSSTCITMSDGKDWDVLQTPEQIMEALGLEKLALKKKRVSKRKAKR